MMLKTDEELTTEAIEILRRVGYRVLAPFRGGERVFVPEAHAQPLGYGVRRAVIADTETTGLNVRTDRIVQLAVQELRYTHHGAVVSLGTPAVWFEDPGVPIPPEATAIHGITDEMVRGQRFPDLADMGLPSSLLIAHNAAFDAPMLLRRFPELRRVPWACTLDSIDWKARGYASTKLGYLLQDHAQQYFHGHDAGRDVDALGECLATPFADGLLPMQELLSNARQKVYRVIAHNSPVWQKDLLKARGYHWNDPAHPDARFLGFKAWWKDVRGVEAERAWLGDELRVEPEVQAHTARTRYEVD